MCRKFVIASSLETIETRFNARFDQQFVEIPKSYAVSCGDFVYAITCQNPSSVHVLQFGMTPYYATESMNIVTARAEGDKNRIDDPLYNGSKSIFLQPAFKKPIQSQRCIVIADAYYEWSYRNKPYLVFLHNKNRPFGFAGIFDQWQNPESKELVTSFAIITTTANSLLQNIGVKRMPVILSRSDEYTWIKSSSHLSDVLRLLVAYPAEKMNAYPVSEMINIPGINDPLMLNPIGDKIQTEINPTYITGSHHSHKTKSVSDTPWFDLNLKLNLPNEIK
jgi:putative SOS response-associated peptidase YedK